jgi:hypothetical protein
VIPNLTEGLAAGVHEHVDRDGEHPDVNITYTDPGPLREPWRVRFAVSSADGPRRGKGHRRWQWRTVTGMTITEALDRARAEQISRRAGFQAPSPGRGPRNEHRAVVDADATMLNQLGQPLYRLDALQPGDCPMMSICAECAMPTILYALGSEWEHDVRAGDDADTAAAAIHADITQGDGGVMPESWYYDTTGPDAPAVLAEHDGLKPGDTVAYENPSLKEPDGTYWTGGMSSTLYVSELIDFGRGAPVQAILNDGEWEVSAVNLRKIEETDR